MFINTTFFVFVTRLFMFMSNLDVDIKHGKWHRSDYTHTHNPGNNWLWFMVFNATFNNISVISWRSVLLVEETVVTGEKPRPAVSHWKTSSHNVVLSSPRLSRVWTHSFSGDRHWLNWVVINPTTMTTTVPHAC
jgi:hypothetical protein